MKLAALIIISFTLIFSSVSANNEIKSIQKQSCYSPRPDLYVTCINNAPPYPIVNQCAFTDVYEAVSGTLIKTSREVCFKGYVTWLVGEKIAFYIEGKYDTNMVFIWGPEMAKSVFEN